ncbi:collagen alpha-1(I) chain-like [Canis lupus dingo]|uniref:collagen alpha-1(I) chain-like n=1 Tax=Canis lupus dingo TaxID=286419 RepID=UPI000DC667DC|nr:collagen alpha-1(I) chain-like [Canis lupus dingo]
MDSCKGRVRLIMSRCDHHARLRFHGHGLRGGQDAAVAQTKRAFPAHTTECVCRGGGIHRDRGRKQLARPRTSQDEEKGRLGEGKGHSPRKGKGRNRSPTGRPDFSVFSEQPGWDPGGRAQGGAHARTHTAGRPATRARQPTRDPGTWAPKPRAARVQGSRASPPRKSASALAARGPALSSAAGKPPCPGPRPPPPAPRPGRPHAQLTEPPAGPCARGRVREGQTGGGQRSPTDAASRGSRGGGVPRDPGGRGGEGAGRRAREPRPETESDGETESEAPARAEREAAGRPAETRQDRGGRRGDAGAEVCGPSGDRPRPRAAAARGGGAPGPPRPQLRRVAAKAGGGRAAAQSSAPPLPPPHLHLRRPTRARGPGGRGAGVAGAHPQPGTRCGTLRPPAAPRPRRPRGRRGARGRRRPAVVAAGPARTERRSARLQPSARPGAAPPRSPRSPAAAPPYTCPRAQRAASGLGPRRRAALIARRPHAAPPAADQAQEAAGLRHLVTPPRVPPRGAPSGSRPAGARWGAQQRAPAGCGARGAGCGVSAGSAAGTRTGPSARPSRMRPDPAPPARGRGRGREAHAPLRPAMFSGEGRERTGPRGAQLAGGGGGAALAPASAAGEAPSGSARHEPSPLLCPRAAAASCGLGFRAREGGTRVLSRRARPVPLRRLRGLFSVYLAKRGEALTATLELSVSGTEGALDGTSTGCHTMCWQTKLQ